MENARSRKHIVFAVISFLSPVAAYLIVDAYQTARDLEFWGKFDREYTFVYAMMGIGELVEAVFWTLIGCLIGLVFGGLSFWLKRKALSIGTVALLFNGFPFLLIALALIWGRFHGF
jgi:hypothetical protein